jgi:hypothetical protein
MRLCSRACVREDNLLGKLRVTSDYLPSIARRRIKLDEARQIA